MYLSLNQLELQYQKVYKRAVSVSLDLRKKLLSYHGAITIRRL